MRSHKPVTILLAGLVCAPFALVSRADDLIDFSGTIAGVVRDTYGIPQMGASVTLLNPQQRPIGRVRTNEYGRFELTGLAPALYSVRGTLATFEPAVRRNLLVQPGMRSLLNVSLSTVFSSIQLAYPPLENGNVMSEDWKWVLRTASDARPITRFTDSPAPSQSPRSTAEVVSETRGVVRLSAGDSGLLAGVGDQADLGTAFALSTILSETSSIQVSGNLGYGSQTGIPATALRASYSRELGGGQPEVTLTLRELYIPGRTTAVPESSVPMLRTVSGQIHDSIAITDAVTLAYGSGVDSISFTTMPLLLVIVTKLSPVVNDDPYGPPAVNVRVVPSGDKAYRSLGAPKQVVPLIHDPDNVTPGAPVAITWLLVVEVSKVA